MKTSDKLFVICCIYVPILLISISYESMYNYATYTAPIKNSIDEYPDFLGDAHYEEVPKGIHPYYASITNISPQNDDSIDIDFAENDYQWSNGYKPIPDFSFTQNIKINQTFVVICHDFSNPLTREIFKNSTATDNPEVEVLKYLGPVAILDKIEYKFYHAQRALQTDMPCNYPEIIEFSVDAIDLVVPEYYGKKYDQKRKMNFQGTEPGGIDSGKINPDKDIPIFFEVMLLEQDIEWKMPQREWDNYDFEIESPARICSEILYPNGTTVFLSTMFETPYTLSDMIFHDSLPDDCTKVLPVTEIGEK